MVKTDDQIVEALAGHTPPYEEYCSCRVRPGVGQHVHARHLAEVIEPIIRERQSAAWYEGTADGIAYMKVLQATTHWSYMGSRELYLPVDPYRIEAKHE